MKIDDKIQMPTSWLFSVISTIIVIVGTGAYWISRVDSRLSRIEKALEIAYDDGKLIPDAYGESRTHH